MQLEQAQGDLHAARGDLHAALLSAGGAPRVLVQHGAPSPPPPHACMHQMAAGTAQACRGQCYRRSGCQSALFTSAHALCTGTRAPLAD